MYLGKEASPELTPYILIREDGESLLHEEAAAAP